MLMKLFTILFIIHNSESYFIKNQNQPICANCKFYIPNKNECSNFGTIDIITNEHNYEQALDVRKDNKKCGEDGIFFKKNYFKFITIPYYFFVENRVLSLLCSSVLIPYIGLILFIIK